MKSGQSSLFWQDRPTLVTGATGLLGSWLVPRLLDQGAEVVCLVRDWVPQSALIATGLLDRVKVARGEVQDQALLERVLGEYEVDTVFHLAAQTIVGIANRNPVSTFASNIGGTWAVLEACRRSPGVRQIVLASSDKAYGEHNGEPYKEENPLQGRHPYDVSKSCADLIAQSYAATYGLPVAVTRCGNFFGGGDLNWNRLVPGTIRSIFRGQQPVIRSDGSYVRDYIYIEDAAAAYMLLAERLGKDPGLRGQAFNFAHDTTLTVLELTQRILELMGSDLSPDVRNETSNEILFQSLDASKARQTLNWTPLFSLDAGLEKTIAWYERFLGVSG
ncbi:MAG: GDP-mannose 4,6-dehydratase [Syntrophales bacterium]|nr:GDP-mannose 4,6-dehydratase [Syntrophales bacterium]MDD5640354.1 GDP-mannose 4,6-dehydratase [Syntrophales bacterium]